MELKLSEKAREIAEQKKALGYCENRDRRSKEYKDFEKKELALDAEFNKAASVVVREKLAEMGYAAVGDMIHGTFSRNVILVKRGQLRVQVDAFGFAGSHNYSGYSEPCIVLGGELGEKALKERLEELFALEKTRFDELSKESVLMNEFLAKSGAKNRYDDYGEAAKDYVPEVHEYIDTRGLVDGYLRLAVEGRGSLIRASVDLRFNTESVEKAVEFYKEVKRLAKENGVEV